MVNAQGAYTGSVPQGDNTGTILPLRLDYALTLGLRNNLGAVTEALSARQAKGQEKVTRGELLPQVNTVVSDTVQQINLRRRAPWRCCRRRWMARRSSGPRWTCSATWQLSVRCASP